MSTLNAYATLEDYKAWFQTRGGTTGTDTADDAVIKTLLKGASRYIQRGTGRRFTPFVETRYFDVPDGGSRLLELDEDLLEVITLTNGDSSTIASTEYSLEPVNDSPYRAIRLKGTSTYYWAVDSSGETHNVISVLGLWGCHHDYNNAWATGSDLAEDLDATETGIDVDSGANFDAGQIVRFNNELSYISSSISNTLTGTRGENSSTATTHTTGDAVTIWQVEEDVKLACLQIVENVYSLRAGQSSIGRVTVTAAGVVIRPEEVPAMAMDVIESFRFRT